LGKKERVGAGVGVREEEAEGGVKGGTIHTKQKRAAREQRNTHKPRTETGTTPSNTFQHLPTPSNTFQHLPTPSNQTRRQAGGFVVGHDLMSPVGVDTLRDEVQALALAMGVSLGTRMSLRSMESIRRKLFAHRKAAPT